MDAATVSYTSNKNNKDNISVRINRDWNNKDDATLLMTVDC